MKAKNIHKTAFNLESGVVKPGETGEFTGAEFMFLAKMGRAEIVMTAAEKGAATKAANKAAQTEEPAQPEEPDFS